MEFVDFCVVSIRVKLGGTDGFQRLYRIYPSGLKPFSNMNFVEESASLPQIAMKFGKVDWIFMILTLFTRGRGSPYPERLKRAGNIFFFSKLTDCG